MIRFCVIVHDVTPVFAPEINQILKHLEAELGNTVSGAVVPRWHGREFDEKSCACFRQWSAEFGEILLHGWTHLRERRPRMVSWLTDRADEFNGLSAAEAIGRIRGGVSLMEEFLEVRVRGFVPPAWQFPIEASQWKHSGIDYVVRFTRIEQRSGRHIPLATWSWDWGRFSWLGRPGAWLGRCARTWNRGAIPVIVLHPADVQRGFLPDAMRLIRSLIGGGWTPALVRDICAPEPLTVAQ